MEFTKLYDGALVLEGGGMRGSYTAGVLYFFIEKDLYFKNCYAVSAGACNCCNYLSKQRGRSYTINVKYAHDKRYAGLSSYITTGIESETPPSKYSLSPILTLFAISGKELLAQT